MGESKRRRQIDPDYGKPIYEQQRFRKCYQITPLLEAKVSECQEKYQQGVIIIFDSESIEYLSRDEAMSSKVLEAFISIYPNDDIVIVNMVAVDDPSLKSTVSFPWRPNQISDGYYSPNYADILK